MIRRPPRSTRTDTLFPYTTLFRSVHRIVVEGAGRLRRGHIITAPDQPPVQEPKPAQKNTLINVISWGMIGLSLMLFWGIIVDRSEERRVGKEGVSTWRSRWATSTKIQNKISD